MTRTEVSSDSVSKYMRAALAETTRSGYSTAWRAFERFVASPQGFNRGVDEATDDCLAQFAAYLAEVEKLAPATCKAYTAGVSTGWIERGLSVTKGPRLGRVLKGVAVLHDDRRRVPRAPFTSDMLRAVQSAAHGSNHENALFAVVGVWLWLGMFRVGELLQGRSERPLRLLSLT